MKKYGLILQVDWQQVVLQVQAYSDASAETFGRALALAMGGHYVGLEEANVDEG